MTGRARVNRVRAPLSAYQRILVTLLQSAPIDFDAESELARLEDDIRADERRQIEEEGRTPVAYRTTLRDRVFRFLGWTW